MVLYPPLSTSLLDCPSKLKEVIDWILRVTGKDGQSDPGGQGTKAITALSNQVKELLKEVEGYATGLSKQEFEKVKQALNDSSDSGNLINKLAGGLQQFIGYDDGTIKLSSTGIGLSNDRRERLGDAVAKSQGFNGVQLTGVTSAELRKSLGKGTRDFDMAVQNMTKLSDSKRKIQTVVETLKNVSNLSGKINGDLDGLASAVSKYLGGVIEAVASDSSVTSAKVESEVTALKNSLSTLVDQLKNQRGPINESGRSQVMTKIKSCYESLNSLGKTFTKLTNKLVARALVYAS
ncbi:variant erythrocyte surface antigen-1, beta subunit [Babesia caballi]|uniref:Variant erythrocyte surface antigen-1, beta subunit n=1 Tax=Babesia caballi TaxID=5871 RepID=A0AAV4LXU8_BABCB|nr:variant erythrocyte surface antigen-1, beta subunit [Babesia caballi]